MVERQEGVEAVAILDAHRVAHHRAAHHPARVADDRRLRQPGGA